MTKGSGCFSDGRDGMREGRGVGRSETKTDREALADMEDFFLSHYLLRLSPLLGAWSKSGTVLGPEPKSHPWSCHPWLS